jgi:aerobic-type carbon monoxide dehydrogenase small subunit (CoxS/CutS family)
MSAPKNDTVIVYVNGEEHQILHADPEWTLAHYLRDHCKNI